MIPVDNNKPVNQTIEKSGNARPKEKFKSYYDEKKTTDKDPHDSDTMVTPLELMHPKANTFSSEQVIAVKGCGEVSELFEAMIDRLTVMENTGDIETTLHLNLPNSVFEGTEITILEYKTAPSQFNIQLKGSPEAVLLLNKHLGALVAAFNAEKRSFKINRFEVHQKTKKHKVVAGKEIKESINDDASALLLG